MNNFTASDSSQVWIVVRQDDNGVKVVVSYHNAEQLAMEAKNDLENYQFKPHKMTYWVEGPFERGF